MGQVAKDKLKVRKKDKGGIRTVSKHDYARVHLVLDPMDELAFTLQLDPISYQFQAESAGADTCTST